MGKERNPGGGRREVCKESCLEEGASRPRTSVNYLGVSQANAIPGEETQKPRDPSTAPKRTLGWSPQPPWQACCPQAVFPGSPSALQPRGAQQPRAQSPRTSPPSTAVSPGWPLSAWGGVQEGWRVRSLQRGNFRRIVSLAPATPQPVLPEPGGAPGFGPSEDVGFGRRPGQQDGRRGPAQAGASSVGAGRRQGAWHLGVALGKH